MSGKRGGVMKRLRQRSPNNDPPAFARYRGLLSRLEVLEKEAQEVRHRVQARRKLIS
jgi:hypothetical protein